MKQRDLEVGHGCVDCAYFPYPTQKQPCKSCKRWSRWEASETYALWLKRHKAFLKKLAAGALPRIEKPERAGSEKPKRRERKE